MVFEGSSKVRRRLYRMDMTDTVLHGTQWLLDRKCWVSQNERDATKAKV
jgi:hypothetical protein